MKKGMIKVSILYPNQEGKNFDMDYYCSKHAMLVTGLLGDALKGASVESGLAVRHPVHLHRLLQLPICILIQWKNSEKLLVHLQIKYLETYQILPISKGLHR